MKTGIGAFCDFRRGQERRGEDGRGGERMGEDGRGVIFFYVLYY